MASPRLPSLRWREANNAPCLLCYLTPCAYYPTCDAKGGILLQSGSSYSVSFVPKMYRPSSSRDLWFDRRSIIPPTFPGTN
jgi:hypothetical protein